MAYQYSKLMGFGYAVLVVGLLGVPKGFAGTDEGNGVVGADVSKIPARVRELGVAWWQYLIGIPLDINPARPDVPDGPIDCSINQRGPVIFIPSPGPAPSASAVARTFSCDIPLNKAIFFPTLTQLTFIWPGFFFPEGTPLEAKRAFIEDGVQNFFCNSFSTIDGVPTNYMSPTIVAQTNPFRYQSGLNGDVDGLGVPAGAVDDREAIAGGEWVLLAPLSKGEHTLRIRAGICDPATGEEFGFLDNTYQLNVTN